MVQWLERICYGAVGRLLGRELEAGLRHATLSAVNRYLYQIREILSSESRRMGSALNQLDSNFHCFYGYQAIKLFLLFHSMNIH